MALAFYLFSVCTFCGVDVARWWFGGNLWIDILVRFVCFVLILIFRRIAYWRVPAINKIKNARTILKTENPCKLGQYAIIAPSMTDTKRAAALNRSISWSKKSTPPKNCFRNLNQVKIRISTKQTKRTRISIHRLPPNHHLGQEHYYQAEKELLEVNEQLLHQQMDLMKESKIEAARIRHDVNHLVFFL